MTVKEMLDLERGKQPGQVVLFESGKFYAACEVSAYMLWQCYGFSCRKRFVKIAGEVMVSVGFPRDSVAKYVPGCVAGPAAATLVGPLNVSEEGFAEWKEALPFTDRGEQGGMKRFASGIEGLDGCSELRHPLAPRFDKLAVYKECYDLLLAVVEWSRNLDKVYQHHLLNRMVDRLFELEVHICAAREKYSLAEAAREVEQAQRKLVEVKVCLRMLGDKNKLNPNVYADATMRVASLDRQLVRWSSSLAMAEP